MKRSKKVIFLIVFLHLAGLFLIKKVFVPKAEAPAKQAGRIETVSVRAETAERQDLEIVLSYVGGLKAKNEAYVYSKVNGKFLEYLLREGDKVEKGQVIALVERDETGLKYEPAKVVSPISGVIGRTFLDQGANVVSQEAAGQASAIAIVLDRDEMAVRLNVPEQDIADIKNGQPALIKVDAYPEEEFKGEVVRVSEVVDIQTRTLPVEISIPNEKHLLKSGMFARINIFAGRLSARLVIAQDALVREDSSDFVYRLEDSKARKVRVKTGMYQDSKVEILEGLEEKQKVITFGHQGLKDGAEVNVVE